MVKRKVKLAQVLCATYSLSNPAGASRSEIVKFCSLRFGFDPNLREYEAVLKRAVDSGLLICFRRRYRLARMGCCILWTDDKKGCGRSNHQHRGNRGKGTREHTQTKTAQKLKHRRKHTSPTKQAKVHRTKRVRFQNKGLKASSTLCKLWCKEKRRRELMSRRQCRREASRSKTISKRNKLSARRFTHKPRNNLLRKPTSQSRTRKSRSSKSHSHRSRSNRPSSVRSQRSRSSSCKRSLTHTSASRRAQYKRRVAKRLTQRKSKRIFNRKNDKGTLRPRHQVLKKASSKRYQEINKLRPIGLETKNTLELKRQEVKNNLRSRLEHPKRPHDHKSTLASSQENVTAQTSKSSTDSSQAQKKEEREDEGVMNKTEYHRQMLRLTKQAVAHAESWDRLNQSRMRRQVENQELVKCSKLVQKILTREHGKSWDDLNEKLRQMKGTMSQPDVGGPGGESGEIKQTEAADPKASRTPKSYSSTGRRS